MGSRGGEWRLGRRYRSHTTTRHKRLRLRVEGMVSVIAPGNWMLALRVVGIEISWELTKSIRDTHVPLRAGWCTPSRLELGGRGKAWLPSRLLRPGWRHRGTIVCHRTSSRRVSLLIGLRRSRERRHGVLGVRLVRRHARHRGISRALLGIDWAQLALIRCA
jgi:hypothetical protein